MTITIGGGEGQARVASTGGPRANAIAASVRTVRFTIRGPGMADIQREVPVSGQSEVTETFAVPQGADRTFTVEALDEGGELHYVGTATVDVFGGSLLLPIRMEVAASNTFYHRWHWRNPEPTGSDLLGIAHGNGIFVAVGAAGTVLTSGDGGATWTYRFAQAQETLRGVAYGNGSFVAVGDAGAVLASADNGVTWAAVRPVAAALRDVAFGNGRFLAVGEGGTVLASVDDGRTWALTGNLPATSRLNGITFGNGAFYAIVGQPSTEGGSANLFVSTDNGATWQSPQVAPSPAAPTGLSVAFDATGIAFGDGRVLIADLDGTLVGFDPATNSAFRSNTCAVLRSIAFGDGVFAAVGDGGALSGSTDAGATWSRRDLEVTRPLRRSAFGNGTLAAVGERGMIVLSTVQGPTVRWSDQFDGILPGSPVETFTVASSAGPNGDICPSGTVRADQGTSQTFTIHPAADYRVLDLLVDGTSVGPLTTYVFTDLAADHTVSASFIHVDYIIEASAGPNGSIVPSGSISVPPGGSQTFVMSSSAGYHVADVVVDGQSVGAQTRYTFAEVAEDHTIAATFGPNPAVTITATAGPNGSITPSGTVEVLTGTDQTFSITPATDYHVADVLVDDASIGPVTTYTFSNISVAHAISAIFAPDFYTVTASAGAGGSITPSGSVRVPSGGNQAFTIAASKGFHLTDVLVDGKSVGPVTTYTFQNIGADHTIAASFAIDRFTITVSAGQFGSITPTTLTVDYGATRTFTITPDPDFFVQDVVVDGTSVGAVTTYTFTNITANHTISATFDVVPPSLARAAATAGFRSASAVSAGSLTGVRVGPIGFGNGVFAAGIFDPERGVGAIVRSADSGATWSASTSPGPGLIGELSGFAYGSGAFVAVGPVSTGGNAALYVSTDGAETWVERSAGVTEDVAAVAFGDGTFVGVSRGGSAVRSEDGGESWSRIPVATGADLRGVAFGGGAFVAVGRSGSAGAVFTSEDGGATWAPVSGFSPPPLVYAVRANGVFVAVDDAGQAFSSPDGRSWVQAGAMTGSGASIAALAYGGGALVAVDTAGNVHTSSDNGESWSTSPFRSPSPLNAVAFGDGAFLAGGGGGAVLRSDPL